MSKTSLLYYTKGVPVESMEQKNKKLKILIIILILLLGISVSALAGTLLYNHFTHAESTTVDAPGNIITPEGENSADSKTDTRENDSFADPSDFSQISSNDPMPSEFSASASSIAVSSPSETTEASSIGSTKASALSLHTKQPKENKAFQMTNMLPGDSETKYYRIKVSYKGDIVVRYHADIRSGYEKLAEVLKVRIRLLGSDVFLYDGLMRDMPKSLNHALYTTQSTESELYYEITAYIDTSVGNAYQDKELIADFRWWVEETNHLDSPQTGDTTYIYLWIALASASLFVLIILLVKRRKETADEQ